MSLTHLSFLLLYSTAVGCFVTFGFVRGEHLGRRYYIYHGLGSAALAGAAILMISQDILASAPLWAFVGFSSLYAVTANRHRALALVSYALATVSGLYGLAYDLFLSFPEGSPIYPHAAYFMSNITLSALVLGFTLAAMLLGHWYLVQPKLPIEELKRLAGGMIFFLVIRFLFCSFVSWQMIDGKTEIEIYRFLGADTAGLFLLMRWIWGLVAPLALCYFIWKTVSMRSTQSATGILYVAVLFVLTGETVSAYLTLYHGIPV